MSFIKFNLVCVLVLFCTAVLGMMFQWPVELALMVVGASVMSVATGLAYMICGKGDDE